MEKAERALDQNLVTSNKERTVATESSSGHHLSWEQFKDSNPLFFSIPTKALKYYFTANKKCKRSRSTAGEQSIAVDAEDWKSCCLWPHCSRTFSRGKEPKRNRIRPWRAHHCWFAVPDKNIRIKNAQFRPEKKNSISHRLERAPSRII